MDTAWVPRRQQPAMALLPRDDVPMKLPGGRRADEGVRPAWRPISAWWWMLAAVAAVVITAFVVTTWLLTIASGAEPGTDQANSRLETVRAGLAAGPVLGRRSGSCSPSAASTTRRSAGKGQPAACRSRSRDRQARGVLCGNCNNGLGMFGEDPARLRTAAAYLEAGGALVPWPLRCLFGWIR